MPTPTTKPTKPAPDSPAPGKAVLRVESVRKSFAEVTAVEDVSFTLNAGEIVGLLGPNGAGKTTIISVICGLLPPTAGRVFIGDRDVVREPLAAKSRLGYVPQDIALYDELSARENLQFWGGMQGLRGGALKTRVQVLLQRVGLEERAREPISRFSGGMKRRLNIAVALMHSPELLLLDEPTVGIDPQARLAILELVREEAAAGRAVLYTTHHLEEAERLCGRILIIDHGRILASGTPEALVAMLGEGKIVVLRGRFETGRVEHLVAPVEGIAVVASTAERILLTVARGSIPALFEMVSEHELDIDDLSVREPDLSSVFIKLTGRELRE
jgi:ABC-2 type transport system ATP-binding protein